MNMSTSNANDFILGIDLGNESTALAYYNLITGKPETVDLSGGYGKPSIPTVVQYLPESDEWLIGEYALFNQEAENQVNDIIKKVGQNQEIIIAGKKYLITEILGIFIKKLLEQIKNINPKATILAITASLSVNITPEVKNAIKQGFYYAGYGEQYLEVVENIECISTQIANLNEIKSLLVLDYGFQGCRGYIFNVENDYDKITLRLNNSINDTSISIEKLCISAIIFFEQYMTEITFEPQKFLHFVYQNRDLLFNNQKSAVNIYYNFLHQPFKQKIEKEKIAELISPYSKKLFELLSQWAKTDCILLSGGGGEMQWVKDTIKSNFINSKIIIPKNAKCIIAEGAAYLAAIRLNLAKNTIQIISEINRWEIGIMLNNENFYPIIDSEKKQNSIHVIINEPIQSTIPLIIYKRLGIDKLLVHETIMLDNLPKRPKGTLKINIELKEIMHSNLLVTVRDLGFGDMFAQTDYHRSYIINPAKVNGVLS